MTGAISPMTLTVSWIGTDTITRSHCSARSAFVRDVDLPETMTSYPARSKTGVKNLPIFPVPPIIPAFMTSLLTDGLFDRHAKMPAAF